MNIYIYIDHILHTCMCIYIYIIYTYISYMYVYIIYIYIYHINTINASIINYYYLLLINYCIL